MRAENQNLQSPENRWFYAKKSLADRLDAYFPYVMLVPLVVIIFAVYIYPLLWGAVLAFFNQEGAFVGFHNYGALFHAREFWHSLYLTFIYVILYTLGVFFVGFVTSFSMWRAEEAHLSGSTIAGAFMLLPYAIPDVVAALGWMWMFDPTVGVFNYALKSLGLINQSVRWLSDPQLALYSVILTTVWRLFPLHTMIILAGFRSVPKYLLEAADIDGAKTFQKFWHILLPEMVSILGLLGILTIVWSFKRFTILWIMTAGGPRGASETSIIYLYRYGFRFFDKNYASAVGTVLLLILTIIVILFFLYRRNVEKREGSTTL